MININEKNPVKLLMSIIFYSSLVGRNYKVGEIVEKLSPENKETIRNLTSDQISKIRIK